MEIKLIITGNFIHTTSFNESEIIRNGIIGVDEKGNIDFVYRESDNITVDQLKEKYNIDDTQVRKLKKDEFCIPGLVDSHIHAAQFSYTGTHLDLPLLEWLKEYTFPTEKKLNDQEEWGSQVLKDCVQTTLRNGSTTCCYFCSLNIAPAQKLVEHCLKYNQRALIGKVCMNQNSFDGYEQTTEENLTETRNFIKHCNERQENIDEKLITPIITPRFVPSCTDELLEGLSHIQKKYDLPIQSHISETINEVKWVKDLHPNDSYTEVYQKFGLLNNKTVMAHGIYLTDKELEIFRETGAGVSHCPCSNFSLGSGVLDVKRLIENEVKVGLGTDVAGGYSPSLWVGMRQAIIASSTQFFNKREEHNNNNNEDNNNNEELNQQDYILNHKQAFYLATLGSASVIGLEDKIGNFQENKSFDALIINVSVPNSPFKVYEDDEIEQYFEKMVMNGDDRNITDIYVQGKLVDLSIE